jgi:hypothetical protein
MSLRRQVVQQALAGRETISRQIGRTASDLIRCVSIFKLGGVSGMKVRVAIAIPLFGREDASTAVAEVWDGVRWNMVAELAPENINAIEVVRGRTRPKSVAPEYANNPTLSASTYAADENLLLSVAAMVLEG